jgi:Icc-related predicted phosphoesterase
MRVLALADRPFHADVARLVSNYDVDAIVTLGDLQPSWLESLDKCCQPKLGVYGNHDDEPYMTYFGIDNVHLNQICLDDGTTFAGFEGCVSYRRSGIGRVGPSYTQRQARKLVRKLPRADVLLCHCPPRGVNDDPEDPAHIGWDALRDWVDKYQPRWLLHGHVHPRPGSILERIGDTRVVYVNGAKVLNLT